MLTEQPPALASQQGHFGLGLYSLPEVAGYIQANRHQVMRWSVGYSFKDRAGQKKRSPAVLCRPLQKAERSYVAAFPDMIELRVINLFRQSDLSMPVIRAAVRGASKRFKTQYPFGSQRLLYDGQNIFAEIDPDDIQEEEDGQHISRKKLLEDLRTGQIVMREMAETHLRDFVFEGMSVSRWWPMGPEYVHCMIDPDINFGKPTDSESGVPLDALFYPFKAGDDIDTIARWFQVSPEAVRTAIRFFQTRGHRYNAIR